MSIHRRDFVRGLLASGAAGVIAPLTTASPIEPKRGSVTAAAVQFNPVLGDVDANLDKCRKWVRKAFQNDARWVVLPECFTSGIALDPKILDAHRPLDGEPTSLLKELAKEGGAYVGGSFLAQSGRDVYNTFVLACPDGETTFTHDKDLPSTACESAFYVGGKDHEYADMLRDRGFSTKEETILPREDDNADGVFNVGGLNVGGLNVGAAMCWELIRYQTARRLRNGRVDLLLGASGWWWSDPKLGWPGTRTKAQIRKDREEQLTLIRQTPQRLARMLGVPVIHSNFCGPNSGYSMIKNNEFTTPVRATYLGSSQIVDCHGVAQKRLTDEEGVIVAKIMPGRIAPSEKVKDDFWMPEFDARIEKIWHESGAQGRDFYLEHGRPGRNAAAPG